MYARLYELSRLLPQLQAWEMVNEGMPENYDRGIAVCFDPQGRYGGIKSYRKRDVVYRSGPSNGTDLTPCCKLAGKIDKPHKTLSRLRRAIDELAKRTTDKGLQGWLGHTGERWKNLDALAEDFQRVAEADEVNVQHRAYVFLALQDGENIKPIYLHPDAKKALVDQFLEGLDRGTRQTGTCFLCGGSGRTVYGNFAVLKCYNLDKQGTVVGGFDVKNRPGRNFPVCDDCAVPVAHAIEHAQSNLSSQFAGLTYMVLPAAGTREARQWMLDGLRQNPQRFSLKAARDLLAEEDDLLAAMALDASDELRDHLSFNLVFYQSEQASWRILAEVQQVLPSRVKELWEAAAKIAGDPILFRHKTAGKGKNKVKVVEPLRIGTFTFRTFAGDDLSLKASDRLVREWLAALFERRAVDRRVFVHQLVRAINAAWRKEPRFAVGRALEAWGLYRYALLTGLVEGEPNMKPETPNSPYGKYCADHADFFNRQEKVTAFLMGCYCGVVASVQRKVRGAAPFAKKYQGRLLNSRDLRRLYHEGRTKLAQYKALGIVIKDLDPDVAESFVGCRDQWGISEDDTTFAFNVGLSLQYRIHVAAGGDPQDVQPHDEEETD